MPDPTIPTCPTCGALPELHAGVVASVRITADGTAVISIDLSDLADAATMGDWAFACHEGSDHSDAEAFTEASHDLEPLLADIGRNCAPAMDYTIGSGANRG